MILGKTKHFVLEREGDDIFLMHDEEVLIQGCNKLIDFAVKLPIMDMEALHTRLPILEALDISRNEKKELEDILSTHIIKGNVCFDSMGFGSEMDFTDDSDFDDFI